MAYRNFIYLTEEDLDKSIYRIMPLDRLIECLTTERLVLVKPKLWDDPFENYMLSATVELESGERGTMEPLRNSVYGQCWTRHRETDAMWRIYSPDKCRVRVRSTPRKLFNALKDANQIYGDVTCFIGQVQYHYKKDLVARLQSIRLMNTDGSGIAESLLHKRHEFAHEEEVRLVHNTEDKVLAKSDHYSFPIVPNDLFEQAIFDPRMDRTKYRDAKNELRSHGYRNTIGQSLLYRPPPELIIKL